MELTKTQAEIELGQVRHELNNPKLKLFETQKLQRKLGELLRQVEQEQADANSHSSRP